MNIKTNKELSLGALVDSGRTKDEICKLKNITPEAYDKAYDSLMLIREAKRRAAESMAVEVTIEGHNGRYRMDMESREFRSIETPEHYIPFENVPFKITSFTCSMCQSLSNKLDYKETGTYSLHKGLSKDDYVPEKTEFSCPMCHEPFKKDILRVMGAMV